MGRKLLTIFLLLAVILYTPTGIIPHVSAQTTEAERTKQLEKELSLNLPDLIDDPNYPVTFVDPSTKGVEITLDGKTTVNAPSPFLLPNLTVGAYEMIFKYTNAEGLVRVLGETIYIVPKAPVFDATIKTTVVRPSQVIISGTAMPQSTLQIIINSQSFFKTTVTNEGKWEITIPNPTEGRLNIIAFAQRNGFTSDASKSITVEYKLQDSVAPLITSTTESWESVFATEVQKILVQIENYRNQNENEFFIIIGATASIVVILFLVLISRRFKKKKEERNIESLFGDSKNNKTILDIVSESSNDRKEITVEKKTEKIIVEVKKPAIPKEKKKAKTKKEILTEKVITERFELKRSTPKTEKTKSKGMKITREQLSETKEDGESEQPTKKILSKEEFLKQFKPKNERNE